MIRFIMLAKKNYTLSVLPRVRQNHQRDLRQCSKFYVSLEVLQFDENQLNMKINLLKVYAAQVKRVKS